MNLVLLPTYGDIFSLDKFIEACNTHCLIDWDGTGYYVLGDMMDRDAEARPSDIVRGNINRQYTDVIWFNK